MRYPRAFFLAAALAVTAPLAACSSGLATVAEPPAPASSAPTKKAASPTKKAAAPTEKAAAPAKPKTRAKSDLSGLKITGIKAGQSVLIDVADDDEDRYLAVGEKAVAFTGTERTDTTMMSLHPAAVSAANRVVIKPPFWNEDLGDGYCVADTTGASPKLEVCQPGKAAQIWRVVLAGDSGLFELHGAYGVLDADGRTALQVLPYAE